jgi:hypothetical protein
MAIFKRLVQNPSSPDKDIKAAGKDRYRQSTFARLSDTNALSRDLNDQKLYSVDAGGATSQTASVAITTKKGIVKITNAHTGATTFTLTLTNSELLAADVDNYFIQVNVGTATTTTTGPSVKIIPVTAGQFGIVIITNSINWATNPTYVYYNIVKVGD